MGTKKRTKQSAKKKRPAKKRPAKKRPAKKRPAKKRPVYRPTIEQSADGRLEQHFTANIVHIDDDVIAFGDVVADREKGLPYGTPVHSLMFHLESGKVVALEFNDQGNGADLADVAGVELARDSVRVALAADIGLVAGRVRLSKAVEIFKDAEKTPPMIGAVRVTFSVDDATFETLRVALER